MPLGNRGNPMSKQIFFPPKDSLQRNIDPSCLALHLVQHRKMSDFWRLVLYRNNLYRYILLLDRAWHMSAVPYVEGRFSEWAKYHCEASQVFAHRDGWLKKTDEQKCPRRESTRGFPNFIQFLRNALNSELTILTAGHRWLWLWHSNRDCPWIVNQIVRRDRCLVQNLNS